MNVIGMMRPKYSTTYLEAEDTLRDGLDIMKKSGYTAVPVIDREGRYVGTVKEGDFLWKLLEHGDSILDEVTIRDIIRTDWNMAATDEEDMDSIINRTMTQNFIPVVDDRGCYIGIITRRDMIQNILDIRVDSRYIVLPDEQICTK